jgi:hypothetical protein
MLSRYEKEIVRAIIGSLHVPRNRFGGLDLTSGRNSAEATEHFARELNLPHGGYDRIDKAVMLLQSLIGDKVKSIMDYVE